MQHSSELNVIERGIGLFRSTGYILKRANHRDAVPCYTGEVFGWRPVNDDGSDENVYLFVIAHTLLTQDFMNKMVRYVHAVLF